MSRYNVRLLPATVPRLQSELAGLGVEPEPHDRLLSDGIPLLVRLEALCPEEADLLVREVAVAGWRGALSAQEDGAEGRLGVLLVAPPDALRRIAASLRARHPEGLSQLALELGAAVDAVRGPLHQVCTIGQRDLAWGERTYVMGIVNVTPDSFSGDGLLAGDSGGELPPLVLERALAQAERHLGQGADMLDVGGESTRPGSSPVTAEAELARVLPVIRALRARTDAPISIDTYKAEVAQAALDAGADLVNDVWALKMDPDMAPLVAERGVPLVLMHNRSRPKNAQQEQRLGGHYVGIVYKDLLADVLRELRQQIEVALAAGISPSRIIVDPGIGFGKTVEQNLELLNRLGELRVLGYPILLGPSRKSFIGYTLDLPPEERVEGTAAAIAVGLARGGADIVRVHDVEAISRVVRMTDAITRA